MNARRVLALAWPLVPLVILVALPFNGLNGFLLDLFLVPLRVPAPERHLVDLLEFIEVVPPGLANSFIQDSGRDSLLDERPGRPLLDGCGC